MLLGSNVRVNRVRVNNESANSARMKRAHRRAIVLAATLLAAILLGLPLVAAAQQVRMLVQSSPLAGFTYSEAPQLWQRMQVGDALALTREPDNAHDARAIRVEWQGHKVGYVPRAQNAAVAWAMDRGASLSARISRLLPHANPRKRVEFEVFVE
jgi:HIRAN domain